jgi:hypothetical protein
MWSWGLVHVIVLEAREAAGESGGEARPARMLEKLPSLGDDKRAKKKRLSWADGQFAGKVSAGAATLTPLARHGTSSA